MNVIANKDLFCDVAQRVGDSLTFKNSERTEQGWASAGKFLPNLVREGLPTEYIKDVTVAPLTEYAALVCYTVGSYVIPQCAYPTDGCTAANPDYPYASSPGAPGGDGLILMPGDGLPVCSTVWIEGYGSSTYNSDVFNNVADATQPVNVGIVTSLQVGVPRVISWFQGMYPSVVALKPMYAVLCFAKTTPHLEDHGSACHLITSTNLPRDLWQFNAPVDCVNGFGCPSSAASARRFRQLAELEHE
jgi:hypothetical protein